MIPSVSVGSMTDWTSVCPGWKVKDQKDDEGQGKIFHCFPGKRYYPYNSVLPNLTVGWTGTDGDECRVQGGIGESPGSESWCLWE